MARALRDYVELRAGHRCEYCQFPATLTWLPFQLDHVLAQKHGGETRQENLALACFYCNSYKGSDIAGVDPISRELTRLYNPRLDTWTEHFKWNGPVLLGLTPVARATVRLLRINHPDAIAVRASLIAEGIFPPQ